ncbi:DNA translocase FtsK [Halobacillus yeomjeoni]|uniref:DNA translocase FtsK n=1 Tax=Halobacillus yeomjeoni TaxID=311194 RepID=A0A931HVD2_9BACI|nr:DNA translocase FtsK [Halobacillus yeomjeoni]MBH0230183.1 DNA translocase FtsK [Halobacillus yeomjeoni]
MWNDFKNKLKQWFDSNENESNQKTENELERREMNAKTKMTYRYPKQGEFRFPVIPDRQKSEETSEPPKRELEQRPRRRKQQPEVNNYTEKKNNPKRESTKDKRDLPETSSVPFTPTDVPSPIYGYHSRQLKVGLEKLESTMGSSNLEEKNDEETEVYGMNDEEWEEMRRRLRSRVSEGNNIHKPSDNPKVADEQTKDESSEHTQLVSEEAATVETSSLLEKNIRSSQEENETLGYEETQVNDEKDKSFNQFSHQIYEESEVEEESSFPDEVEDEGDLSQTQYLDETDYNVESLDPHEEENSHEEEIIEESESIVEEGLTEINENTEDLTSEEISLQSEKSSEKNNEETPSSGDTHHSTKRRTESSDLESGISSEINDDTVIDHSTHLEETEEVSKETSEETHPKDFKSDKSNKKKERSDEKSPAKEKKRTVPFNVIMTPRDKRTRDMQHNEINKNKEAVEKKTAHNKDRPTDLVNEKGRRTQERVNYKTPLHLLEDPIRRTNEDDSWIQEQMELLETTLRHFHVRANVVNAMKGPTVTRYEVQPEPGVKVSKITNLADDIKLSMAAKDIRIEAPIPGKQAVGIELPNLKPQMVGLQEIFESNAFQNDTSPLSVGLGLDIGGDSVVTNLKKMPHGLIAGATGSGKSVCINTILVSLLYKAHHEDVKFLLIDPKMVELAPYNDLPHLVSPVITDVKAATTALKWAVKEMEERYEKFVDEGARDVERYNEKMMKQGRQDEKLPYLVIVIDELADLMMVSPQDVEDSICRIAQKARACGIHLLLATQRPSVDVITGLIKANIPTRIAFSVSSQVDSRTIIDSGGAEKLLGKGDMLFVENGSGQPHRIQGAFVSDDEIERVTNYVKKMAPPQYLFHQEELMRQVSSEEETDELFDEAVQFVVNQNGASASLLQRRFKVGYNRAARLIDQMEDYGIISEQKGSKPRDILLSAQQIEDMMDGR